MAAPFGTGLPAVAPATTTFSEFYSLSPHTADVLVRQLAPFDVNVQGVQNLTPTEVVNRLQALTLEGLACPLLALEVDPASPQGRVRIYHALAHCPVLPDRAPHEWMGRNFMAHGEIFNRETDTYEQPGGLLDLISRGAALRCLETVQVRAAFDADPAVVVLGPFDNAEPNTEAIVARRSCFLPPRFAARLLEESFTPREAYLQLGDMIQQESAAIQVACLPLTRWLQHIVHRPLETQAHSHAVLPRFPTASSRPLREHRCRINFRYLPSLDQQTMVRREAELLATRVGEVAAELQRQTEEQKAASAARSRPKTVTERWPEVAPNIRNIAQVDTDLALPPIWTRLANAKKEDARIVIEGCFEQAINNLGAVGRSLRFPVEAGFASMILNVRLRMTHVDDLTSGLQPFSIGQVNSESQTRAAARNILYDQAAGANAAVSLSEVSALTTLLVKDQVPTSPFEGLRTMRLLYVAVGALLGLGHELTAEMEEFLEHYQMACEDFLPSYSPITPGYSPALTHALILRYVQVRLSTWWDKQWVRERPLATPNLVGLFDKIRLREQWEIPLPPNYAEHFNPARAPRPAPTPGLPPQPAPPIAPNPPSRDSGGMVINSGHNLQAFQRFIDLRMADGQRITARRARRHANNEIPSNMCVAYHVVGRCNENCSRNADHAPHSAEQDATLVTWCEQHWRE